MATTVDLAIIGGGSAGLSALGFGVESGASVALIERQRIGGDCTWSGCVPSKSLLKSAKIAHAMRAAAHYGIAPVVPEVDLAAVMQHVREIVAETYEEERPEVLEARGAQVLIGPARFLDPHTLQMGDVQIRARNVVIATGASPFIPPIPGIDAVPYLTYESIWQLQELPRHLIVLGGGPIGAEMAQAFRRLGSEVTQIEAADRILGRDDAVAARVLMKVFTDEGIRLLLNAKATRVWREDSQIHVQAGASEIVGDALLVAVGRHPNVTGLDLERAGVAHDTSGIKVNPQLQTSQRHIYAAGDCIGSYQFSHYAGWQGTMAARNALLPGSSKAVLTSVPWTTFTDPEVAHVGVTETEARARYGDAVETTEWPLLKNDRARAEVDRDGLAFLVHRRGQLLGATIVAERAGEMIHEWAYVIQRKLNIRDVTTTMHIYPTYSGLNVRVGGAVLQKLYLSGRTGALVARLSRLSLALMRLQRGF